MLATGQETLLRNTGRDLAMAWNLPGEGEPLLCRVLGEMQVLAWFSQQHARGGRAASAVQSSAAGRSELVRQQLIMLLAEMMSNQILESPRFQLRSCKDWTIFRSVGLPWDFPQRRTI